MSAKRLEGHCLCGSVQIKLADAKRHVEFCHGNMLAALDRFVFSGLGKRVV